MNKTNKRILALVLTLCTMFGLMVPMASAVTDPIVYNFVDDESTNWSIVRNASERTIAKDSAGQTLIVHFNWKYDAVNGSSGTDYQGRWVAIEIKDVLAGTYDATFFTRYSTGNGGFSNVFVVNSEEYKTAEAKYFSSGETKLTQEKTNELFSELNFIKESRIDSYKYDTNSAVTQSVGSITFTETNPEKDDYVLIFQCYDASGKTSVAQLAISTLTLTPVVATVDDTAYTDSEKAVAAINDASSGTVKLFADIETTNAIEIKDGVTLDLNGKTLEATSVTTFGTGNVIDSSENADGILKVAADKLSLQSTNTQFALYDSENGGYKFYTATVENDVKTVEVDKTTNKYWFRITFSADSAYDLIAKGDSGLKIEATLRWDNGFETATPDASFYEGWAKEVKADHNIAISLTVKGVDKVKDLSVKANIINIAATAAA